MGDPTLRFRIVPSTWVGCRRRRGVDRQRARSGCGVRLARGGMQPHMALCDDGSARPSVYQPSVAISAQPRCAAGQPAQRRDTGAGMRLEARLAFVSERTTVPCRSAAWSLDRRRRSSSPPQAVEQPAVPPPPILPAGIGVGRRDPSPCPADKLANACLGVVVR